MKLVACPGATVDALNAPAWEHQVNRKPERANLILYLFLGRIWTFSILISNMYERFAGKFHPFWALRCWDSRKNTLGPKLTPSLRGNISAAERLKWLKFGTQSSFIMYSWGPNKRTGTAIYLVPIFHLVRAYLVPVRLLIFEIFAKNIQNWIFWRISS